MEHMFIKILIPKNLCRVKFSYHSYSAKDRKKGWAKMKKK